MSEENPFGKIKINKLVSTIILGTTFSTTLLFGLVFYMYFDPKLGYTSALKDSLSITAGFFGGITTLVAAYIASQLFNDWKDQQNHQNTVQFGMEVYSAFKEFDRFFIEISHGLIKNDVYLKGALEKNDLTLILQYLSEGTEISKLENELTSKFMILHDSIINYCVVTNQENIIEEHLGETEQSIAEFCKNLSQIRFEDDIPQKQYYMELLLSPPFSRINSFIYNFYIKSILLQIRLT